MRSAKIQLENYFVEELFYKFQDSNKLSADNPPKLIPSNLEVKVGLADNKENGHKKLCILTISLKEETKKSFPYDFKVSLVGFFEIDSSCPDNEVDLLLSVNAPSVLFSAARELLLLVTGRARFFPLMLPTVIFLANKNDETINEIEEKSNEKKSKTKKTSTVEKTPTAKSKKNS